MLSYLKNYGQDCYKRIYCYEITPKIFALLRKNLEQYRDIEFRMKGVADTEGTMFLVSNQTSASANTLGQERGEEVPVTTLDQDITEPVTLIKADIEGFEQKALEGAKHPYFERSPQAPLFRVSQQ